MASSSSSSLIFISIFIFISLISPSHSAGNVTCASQKLPSNRTYKNCTDLPVLGATLHFTYNNTNRSLSIAFTAVPVNSNGWVSWGINPTGTGKMVGTEALVAFKVNGKIQAHLYNLSSIQDSYDAVKSLSFETWDLSAEESNGVITIFAGVKLPEKADNTSQLWQVGPVVGGKIGKHDLKPDNFGASLKLSFGGDNSTSGGGNSTSSGKSGGVSLVMGGSGFGFYFGFVLLLLSLVTIM